MLLPFTPINIEADSAKFVKGLSPWVNIQRAAALSSLAWLERTKGIRIGLRPLISWCQNMMPHHDQAEDSPGRISPVKVCSLKVRSLSISLAKCPFLPFLFSDCAIVRSYECLFLILCHIDQELFPSSWLCFIWKSSNKKFKWKKWRWISVLKMFCRVNNEHVYCKNCPILRWFNLETNKTKHQSFFW